MTATRMFHAGLPTGSPALADALALPHAGAVERALVHGEGGPGSCIAILPAVVALLDLVGAWRSA